MDGPEETLGDSACWLHRVCEDCGAIVDERNGHRPGCELAGTRGGSDVGDGGQRPSGLDPTRSPKP